MLLDAISERHEWKNRKRETFIRTSTPAASLNSHATSLDAWYRCKIGDVGVAAVAEALQSNTQVTQLECVCWEEGRCKDKRIGKGSNHSV